MKETAQCDLTPIEVLAVELRDDEERVFHYRTDDDGHIILFFIHMKLLNFRRHHWTSSSLMPSTYRTNPIVS